jgi:RNA polymerase I-specific transcription initiation factor RRN6
MPYTRDAELSSCMSTNLLRSILTQALVKSLNLKSTSRRTTNNKLQISGTFLTTPTLTPQTTFTVISIACYSLSAFCVAHVGTQKFRMAKPVLKDLPYGHFGQPQYDQDEKKWVFGRVLNSQPRLHVLGAWEEVFKGCSEPAPPSDIKRSQLGPDTAKTKARSGTRFFSQISDVHTSLSGLESFLYPDLLASWAVASSLHLYDPSVGDLLAVGKVPVALRVHVRASSVFACPGGESGSVLRLMETYRKECTIAASSPSRDVQRYRIAYPTDNDVWIRHQGYAIKQVAFSPQDDPRVRYLGVRSMSNTVIYTIGVLAHASRARTLDDPAFRAPGLTVERNCNIPVDSLRNTGHSDLVFNPWVPGECAVIDRYGKWFIYNVQDSPEEQSKERMKPLHSGRVKSRRNQKGLGQTASSFGDDGWARIHWVFNGEYLILCQRKNCQMVDLKSKQVLDIILAPDDDENWILDARTGIGNKDNLFFLTNRKIYWVQLVQPDDPTGFSLGYEVFVSVRHFRDPKDMTLKIKILELDGGR